MTDRRRNGRPMPDPHDPLDLEWASEEADRRTEEEDLQDYIEYVREHLDD